MNLSVFRIPLLSITVILHLATAAFAAADTDARAAKLQNSLDRQDWSWNEDEASIFYSMMLYGAAYQIEIIRPPGGRYALTIRFVKDGKVAHSWVGHSASVFVQKGDLLTYALYSQYSNGCAIVAVDLTTGKELWRTELRGIGRMGHSGYSNLVTLTQGSDDILIVKGHEGFGDYVEYLDQKTGKTLAHRVFAKRSR